MMTEVNPGRPQFKPYRAYKSSGTAWMSEVPTQWQVLALKRSIAFTTGWTPPTGAEELYDGDLPWANISDLGPHWLSEPQRTISEEAVRLSGAIPSPAGSLLFAFKLSVGAVSIAAQPMYTNEAIATFLPNQGVAIDYLYWAAPICLPENSIENIYGARLLSRERIANALLLVPPIDEQRSIAAFLDRETTKIDALIANRLRLIELLAERRTGLVARAVTKGLDPSAPMKDSGLQWLGKTPAHWEVTRTKFVATLRSGHTPSRQHPEYWENCSIPWFGLADVWQIRDGGREYVSETAEMISELGLANSAARLLPKDTVIVSRTASVGFSAILGVDMATTQDFVNWICGQRIRPEYLLYVFRSMRDEFRRLNMGSTHQTIYMPDVGRFCTPLPPLAEQDEIVDYVRARTSEIDTLVAKVGSAIERLRELRSAVISAAVTGKIDVRAVA